MTHLFAKYGKYKLAIYTFFFSYGHKLVTTELMPSCFNAFHHISVLFKNKECLLSAL